MGERRATPRVFRELCWVLALLPVLAGCTAPGAGAHYLPANTAVDPYSAVRARAISFFQAGANEERQGNWRKALDDYRQARLWDPDNRQDIQDALDRAQARVDAMAPLPPTPSSQGNVSQPAPVPTAPPAAQRAQAPTPTATASRAGVRAFQSHNFPYTISYPADWLAKQGGTSQQPIDTFVGQPAPNVAAVVMITEEPIDSAATLDEISAATARDLASRGINDVQVAERRQVDGQLAYVLTYHLMDEIGKPYARHAILVTPGHAWQVILLATPGTTPDLVKTFDAMLDSLQLLPSAFPVASTGPRNGYTDDGA